MTPVRAIDGSEQRLVSCNSIVRTKIITKAANMSACCSRFEVDAHRIDPSAAKHPIRKTYSLGGNAISLR